MATVDFSQPEDCINTEFLCDKCYNRLMGTAEREREEIAKGGYLFKWDNSVNRFLPTEGFYL